MQPFPECADHSDLRERLVEARKLYKAAVAALGRMRPGETEAANDRVKSARLGYLNAWSDLLELEGEHFCGFCPD
jgi:hypothetical protein